MGHHYALIPSLPPRSQVNYRVGDGAGNWSSIFQFTSAPTGESFTFSASIFGDMGYEDSSQRPMVVSVAGLAKDWSATFTREVLEDLKNNGSIDFVWHLGDIGYADDSFAHSPIGFTYEKDYNGYMNWMQNITSKLPYMVSP